MRIIPDIRAKRDSESKFDVTRFKVLTCRLPEKQYQVVTLDGQTGHPISNAKVTMYSNDEKVLQEFTTDKDGKVVFPWKSRKFSFWVLGHSKSDKPESSTTQAHKH